MSYIALAWLLTGLSTCVVKDLLLIYYIYKEDELVGKYKKESPSASASALQHHMKEFLIARGGRAPIIWAWLALCKMERIVYL